VAGRHELQRIVASVELGLDPIPENAVVLVRLQRNDGLLEVHLRLQGDLHDRGGVDDLAIAFVRDDDGAAAIAERSNVRAAAVGEEGGVLAARIADAEVASERVVHSRGQHQPDSAHGCCCGQKKTPLHRTLLRSISTSPVGNGYATQERYSTVSFS
jgi:hypothetical protein